MKAGKAVRKMHCGFREQIHFRATPHAFRMHQKRIGKYFIVCQTNERGFPQPLDSENAENVFMQKSQLSEASQSA